MPPPPRRTITLLDARSASSASTNSESSAASTQAVEDIKPSRPITGPSPAPPSEQSGRKSSGTTESDPASTETSTRMHRTTRSNKPTTSALRYTYRPDSSSSLIDSSRAVTSDSIKATSFTRETSFATSTRVQTQQPSTTIAGPPVWRTRVAVPSTIPDPPAWFPYLIAAFLGTMMMLAVLFYCVNFPTTGRSFRERIRDVRAWFARKNSRYGYEKLEDEEIRDSNRGVSPHLVLAAKTAYDRSAEVPAAGFTTSANTPNMHNTPTLYSRRRRNENANMSVDTGKMTGLGIFVDDEHPPHDLSQQKSFDESIIHKPLPMPPKSPAKQAVHSAQAFFTSTGQDLQRTAIPRQRPDIENGLLKPPDELTHASPSASPSKATPPSPGFKVLEMVGDSVEYAAWKMSRMMYNQVNRNPEEGLLLPVRDCERERELEEVY